MEFFYVNIYILKSFIADEKILVLYFLLTFCRTKLSAILLWILSGIQVPTKEIGDYTPLRSVMSQEFALQQRV
jgi:hypothetical protein